MFERANWPILLFNAFGSGLYLSLASAGWRSPIERGSVPVTGEPFAWIICLPVLIVLFLVNILWGTMLYKNSREKGVLIFSISITIMVSSIIIDFYHH